MKSLIILVAIYTLTALAQDPRPRSTTLNGTVIGGGSRGTTPGPIPGPAPRPVPQEPGPLPTPMPREEYKYDCQVVMVKSEIYGRKRTLFTYIGVLDGSGTCREALVRCRSEVASENVVGGSCWQVLDQVDI